MSGSGVPCRAQDGGLQQLLDRIQTVRIRRRIGDLDLAAFDGNSFRFSGGIADNVHTIDLLPGEERCVDFRDANGIPKVHHTYCSFRGRLFNCTCCTKDEAQRLCEDWLVKQDRCYIN